MLFTLQALVLDKDKVNEIDYLVELLTPKGRLRVLAKGAQKSKRRFLNLLEDLTLIRSHLRKPQRGKTLILESADPFYIPEGPRRDLVKFYFFSYLAETMKQTFYAPLGSEGFNFVVQYLKILDQEALQEGFKTIWEYMCLKLNGLEPYLEGCVRCGERPKRIFYFSPQAGGILCFQCRDERARPLEQIQIDLLRKIGRIKKAEEIFELLEALQSERGRGIQGLLEEFFLYHIDWEPRALRILKEALHEQRGSP